MSNKSPSLRRIQADIRELSHDPSDRYHAMPLENDMFEWHFTIRGADKTDFEGGIYHGRILLPAEYPFKPPHIMFLTPTGRFEINTKICLSFSAYHPELWQPAWGIRLILEALISFLPTPADGAIGALDWSSKERKRLAKKSVDWCCPTCGKIVDLIPKIDKPKQCTPVADGGSGGEPPKSRFQKEIEQLQMLQLREHKLEDKNDGGDKDNKKKKEEEEEGDGEKKEDASSTDQEPAVVTEGEETTTSKNEEEPPNELQEEERPLTAEERATGVIQKTTETTTSTQEQQKGLATQQHDGKVRVQTKSSAAKAPAVASSNTATAAAATAPAAAPQQQQQPAAAAAPTAGNNDQQQQQRAAAPPSPVVIAPPAEDEEKNNISWWKAEDPLLRAITIVVAAICGLLTRKIILLYEDLKALQENEQQA